MSACSGRYYLDDNVRSARHGREMGELAVHHVGPDQGGAPPHPGHPKLGRLVPFQDLLPRQPGSDRLVYLVLSGANARGEYRGA